MKQYCGNLLIPYATLVFALSCASIKVDDSETSDTSQKDSGPADLETENDTETDSDTEKILDTGNGADASPCGDDTPTSCGIDCINCTATDKPQCAQGACVECLTPTDCGPNRTCTETNECIDPCADPAACPVPAPRCEDGNLVISSLESCDASTGAAVCKFTEITETCDFGCMGTSCNASICVFDEDGDQINDVVEQPGSSPTRCWRRCAIPAKWDGTQCQGSVGIYNWSPAKKACEDLGYRLPEAAEYTGPAIASGILNNCVIAGDEDLDWDCDSCATSTGCNDMFGNDQGTYWTATSRTYYLQTTYYKANLSSGMLNFVNGGHTNGARCVKSP